MHTFHSATTKYVCYSILSRWSTFRLLCVKQETSSRYMYLRSIIRPHCNTTYIDMAYCYRLSSVVCQSVCHTSEPCKNSCSDQDAAWVQDLGVPKTTCIRWGSRSPTGRGNFEGQKGRPIVKHRNTLQWAVQKRLNWSRCHLGCGLGRAKESCARWGSTGGQGRCYGNQFWDVSKVTMK